MGLLDDEKSRKYDKSIRKRSEDVGRTRGYEGERECQINANRAPAAGLLSSWGSF